MVVLRRSGGGFVERSTRDRCVGFDLAVLLSELGGEGGGEVKLLVVDESGSQANVVVAMDGTLPAVTRRLTELFEYAF